MMETYQPISSISTPPTTPSSSSFSQSKNLFQSCEENNVDNLLYILTNGTSPNERDDFGRTSLHICCTYGSCECVAILLRYHADYSLQDYENGWTPLHRSLYFGFIKITFLLLKAGAQLTRPSIPTSPSILSSSPFSSLHMERSLRNIGDWVSPLDHEGNSPLDLLSSMNHRKRSFARIEDSTQCCTELLTFGKADFFLGIPLPRSSLNVTKPRPILDLETEHVVNATASKFHSAALTSDGRVYTWGIGKAGRLGHGNELNLSSPTLLQSFGLCLFPSLL
jgi:inhibitor of Bruton tyrosine kinase